MRLLVVATIAVLALVGCARPPGHFVPPQLLHCTAQPKAPADDGITQRDVALWIVDVTEAGADCRTKLNSVRGLLDQQETK